MNWQIIIQAPRHSKNINNKCSKKDLIKESKFSWKKSWNLCSLYYSGGYEIKIVMKRTLTYKCIIFLEDIQVYLRAKNECLGWKSWRRTRLAAISLGKVPVTVIAGDLRMGEPILYYRMSEMDSKHGKWNISVPWRK